MVHLTMPDTISRPLSFYLATEEYVARQFPDGDYLLLWQVAPSVIYGRSQQLENEVNTAYCQQHGIEVYHRKSGGGCVYADWGNLMVSYITHAENVGFAFNQYIQMMLLVLRKLDIPAVATSHNDIMIGERKVSGTACYKLGSHCIVHGTLLYDTHMEHMTHAITPPQEKLQRHGVQSVRQRICLLREFINLDIDQLREFIIQQLCNGEHELSQADLHAISELEIQNY